MVATGRSIRGYIRRKSVLLRIILSYVVIGSILIALLSSVLYIRFSRSSVQEIKSVTANSLEHTANTFNELWNTTFHYMYKEFKTNSVLVDAMVRTDLSPVEYGTISASLSEIITNYSLFDSVYVYNSNADQMFSSIGPVRSEGDFYDAGIYEGLNTAGFMEGRESKVYVRQAETINGSDVKNEQVITVIFSDDNLRSALIYNINERLLRNMIVTKNNSGTSALLIVDREGRMISRFDPAGIVPASLDSVLEQRMANDPQLGGTFDLNVDREHTLVSFQRIEASGLLNWSFVSVSKYRDLTRSVQELQQYMIGITGVFVLLSIAIAGWFTHNLYSPMRKLLYWARGKFRPEAEGKMNELDEYAYLSRVYEAMSGDIETFRTAQNRNRFVLRNQFWLKVVHGEYVHSEEWEEQEVGLRLPNGVYRAAVLFVDQAAENSASQSNRAWSLYRYSIANIAEEILSESFPAVAVEAGEDQVVVLMEQPRPSESAGVSILMEKLSLIKQACNRYLKLALTIGVGTEEHGIKGIHTSYLHALQASEYDLVFGQGSILDYAAIVPQRNEEYRYPIEIEKKIIDGLKGADEEKVRCGLDDFLAAIEPYTCQEMILAMNQLAIVSARTINQLIEADELPALGIEFDYLLVDKRMSGRDTIADRRDKLLRIYRRTIEAIRKKKETRYGDIAAFVQAHIDEHFADPGLTVEALAELAKLSPNYLRTLFKAQTGITISAYLSAKRYEAAKRLLEQTELPIQQIAETIGFQGGGYFYTAFKKAVGMTPDEYRKQHGRGAEADSPEAI
ncbi:helix-turn-helix domain-containing protein [Cohnella fermenti]|nr:helix-turn-helix domain-containing protein [Cohnella fermenti]